MPPGLLRTSNRTRALGWGCWLLACAVGVWVALPRDVWSNIRSRYANGPVVERLGFFGYALFDVTTSAGRWWHERGADGADPRPFASYLAQVAGNRPAPAANRPRKHVIYIQMEGVDGLAVGGRKRGRPLMPFLDQLAERGTYFTTTIDNTASGRTTDAEFLVLTSAVPRTRPPLFVSESLERIPSLPRELRRAGYRAVSIHGFRGSFWHRAAAHRDLGYDEDIFEDQLAGAERIGWGISDAAVLAAAAREIQSSRQPLFLHVILLTNHHPFNYYGQSIHQPLKSIEESFVQSVGYVDRCIADFYAELERQGVARDCLVAVFSDHDSGITEKLGQFLDPAPPRAYGDTVPLIVTGLHDAPKVVKAVTGLQDLPVMVLEELGLPVPVTFTGNGLTSLGTTVGPIHGALRTNAAGAVESYPAPVSFDELTMLSLYQPDKLAGR